jgi:hypothetical protein
VVTMSYAADVGLISLSSQTCAGMSLATECTATVILLSSSGHLLTMVAPRRCSSHCTTNIHVTQLRPVDLQGQGQQVALSSVPRLNYR